MGVSTCCPVSGLPQWSSGRCEFDPCVGKTPWRRKWQPTPVFLPGEFHGQRSLAGYSSWGCKDSDMTERLTLPLSPTRGPVDSSARPALPSEWRNLIASPQACFLHLPTARQTEELSWSPKNIWPPNAELPWGIHSKRQPVFLLAFQNELSSLLVEKNRNILTDWFLFIDWFPF